jgi:hypothetical protein
MWPGVEVYFSREILLMGIATTTLVLASTSLCRSQPLTSAEALDRYLAPPGDLKPSCSDSVFTVQIDAAMPKLHKQGSMSGLKVISRTGQVIYRGLQFTGDKLVKTAVIARFLANDTNPLAGTDDVAVSRQNYWFVYDKTSDYNGQTAFVFLLKPRRKRAGLFRGELWLAADTAAPLRLWGDLVKSPSIFVRSFRFVQDYVTVAGCSQPLRLLLTTRTRIAGEVEMAVWQHPAHDTPEATKGGGNASDFQNRGQTSR